MQWRAAGGVLAVDIGPGVDETFRRVGAHISRGQVQRRLAAVGRGRIQVGALGQQIGNRLYGVFVAQIGVVDRIVSLSALDGDHERRQAIGTLRVDVGFLVMRGRRHYRWRYLHAGRLVVQLCPFARCRLLVLGDRSVIAVVPDFAHSRSLRRRFVVGPLLRVAGSHVQVSDARQRRVLVQIAHLLAVGAAASARSWGQREALGQPRFSVGALSLVRHQHA